MLFSDVLADDSGRLIVQIEQAYCTPSFLDDVVQHRFSFNEECFDLGARVDWLTNPSKDLEWQILIHKFYFAPGLARQWIASDEPVYIECLIELVTTWIEQVPTNFIASDVTARRVQNWAYAFELIERAGKTGALPADFVDRVEQSIEAQVNAIIGDLAPARNHRTLELYAILVASVGFPALAGASQWRSIAVNALIDNIRTDLQADGVHCEQSTDYHHLVLRSFLLFYRLARLNEIPLPADLDQLLCRALDFTMHSHRPDGKIPALSDSDSRSYLELLKWGASLFARRDYAYVASAGNTGIAPTELNASFASSGYVFMRSDWGSSHTYRDARYLALDAGAVGEGNHGHMDALSIELAAFGGSLVVDPGRYTYHEDESFDWRGAFRSTRAHNTVTIDNLDQGIYRRKRPNSRYKVVPPHPTAVIVEQSLGGHPAFVHAKVLSPNYAPVHHRCIWFARGRYWMVLDLLVNEEASAHDYRLRYQLSPAALNTTRLTPGSYGIELNSPGLFAWIGATHDINGTFESGWVSSTYGSRQAAPRVCLHQKATQASFLTVLCPQQEVLTNGGSSCRVVDVNATSDGLRLSILVDDNVDEWHWGQHIAHMCLRGKGSAHHWSMASGYALGDSNA